VHLSFPFALPGSKTIYVPFPQKTSRIGLFQSTFPIHFVTALKNQFVLAVADLKKAIGELFYSKERFACGGSFRRTTKTLSETNGQSLFSGDKNRKDEHRP